MNKSSNLLAKTQTDIATIEESERRGAKRIEEEDDREIIQKKEKSR